jgi:hypothetical protein
MQEIFSLIEKKLLPTAKKKYFHRPIIIDDPLPNAALPQAEQQLLHSLCTWTKRAIVRAAFKTMETQDCA